MKRNRARLAWNELLRLEAGFFDGYPRAFGKHFHEEYVVGLVLGGVRLLTYENRTQIVQKGDLLFFNPYEVHSCRALSAAPLVYAWICFSKETLFRALGVKTPMRLGPFSVRDPRLAEQFRSFHTKAFCGEATEQMWCALAHVFPQEQKGLSSGRFEPLCALMRGCGEIFSAEELSRRAELDKSYFIRRFVREKHISPYAYGLCARISLGRRLLRGGILCAQAALEAGFADQAHFSRMFSRLTGFSPARYRRLFMRGDSVLSHQNRSCYER